MSKTPLIPIDQGPVEILYESPSILVAKKPQGMPAHGMTAEQSGTLLNLLFQHGRWLAEMEECPDAGVLHVLNDNDHGLSVYIKDDKYTEDLRRKHANGEYRFSYLLQTEVAIDEAKLTKAGIEVRSHVVAGEKILYDIVANTGDTQLLRDELELSSEGVTFFCYAIDIDVPHINQKQRFTINRLVESGTLPKITMFTAPP